MEEYKGYAIEFNLYGKNEYTVMCEDGCLWFSSLDDARLFIDFITT